MRLYIVLKTSSCEKCEQEYKSCTITALSHHSIHIVQVTVYTLRITTVLLMTCVNSLYCITWRQRV